MAHQPKDERVIRVSDPSNLHLTFKEAVELANYLRKLKIETKGSGKFPASAEKMLDALNFKTSITIGEMDDG